MLDRRRSTDARETRMSGAAGWWVECSKGQMQVLRLPSLRFGRSGLQFKVCGWNVRMKCVGCREGKATADLSTAVAGATFAQDDCRW